MAVWQSLYSMTWLLFLNAMLAITAGASVVPTDVHAVLGVAILVMAFTNARAVTASAVPGRVKRTVRSTAQLALLAAVLGGVLLLDAWTGVRILAAVTVGDVLAFAHAFVTLGMFAQAAAAGLAYDMWEEKEFLRETAPGEVPPMPDPAAKPS